MAGLTKEQQELAAGYVRKAAGIARAVAAGWDVVHLRDDLRGVAFFTLTRAARRYDPALGKFPTYAWRRVTGAVVDASKKERLRMSREAVLDLAAGTGTSSLTFTAAGADCVACDFSLGMLRVGRARLGPEGSGGVVPPGRLAFAAGDALRLPFRDGAFDAVTISFGLRNVADPGQALAEMFRVTRPGGRLVVCEFSTITIAPVDMLYRRYLIHVLPAIARRTARNPEAYAYLAESIADWPAQRELAGIIEAAGWSAVRWRDLSLGVVAVHVARRR